MYRIHQLPPPSRPPMRSHGPTGWMRLVIVGGAALLVAYVGWPHARDEMGKLGRQLSHTWGMHLDETQSDPIEDRRGERRGRPDLGNQAGADDIGPPSWRRWDDARPETTGGPPPTPDTRNVRRWRDCRVARNGGLDCGAWQNGPAPQGEYAGRVR
jgi:hypothetical protein